MKKVFSSLFIALAVLFGASLTAHPIVAVAASSYSAPDTYEYGLDSSDWESDWGVDDSQKSYQSSTSSDYSDDAFAGGLLLGFGVLWMLFVGLMVIIGILGMILWIFMLVDVAKRESLTSNERLLWVLVIVLASYLGAIIYYFMVRRPAKKAERAAMAPPAPVAPAPSKESTSSTTSQK